MGNEAELHFQHRADAQLDATQEARQQSLARDRARWNLQLEVLVNDAVEVGTRDYIPHFQKEVGMGQHLVWPLQGRL